MAMILILSYRNSLSCFNTNRNSKYQRCNDTHFGCINISPPLYHDTAIYCMIATVWLIFADGQRLFPKLLCFIPTKQLQNCKTDIQLVMCDTADTLYLYLNTVQSRYDTVSQYSWFLQLTKYFNQLRGRPINLHVAILTVSSLHCQKIS